MNNFTGSWLLPGALDFNLPLLSVSTLDTPPRPACPMPTYDNVDGVPPVHAPLTSQTSLQDSGLNMPLLVGAIQEMNNIGPDTKAPRYNTDEPVGLAGNLSQWIPDPYSDGDFIGALLPE